MALTQSDNNTAPADKNGGILQTLILDAIIAAILLAVYFIFLRRTFRIYRKERKKHEETTANLLLQPTSLVGTSKEKIKNPLKRFYNFVVHERIDPTKHGQEAFAYMTFQSKMIWVVLLCTVLGLVVLLPINMTAAPATPATPSTDPDAGFPRTTVEAVANDPARLWAHLILLWVFVAIVLSALAMFYFNMDLRSFIFPMPQLSQFSIMLQNLPRKFLDQKTLKNVCNEVLPNQIVDAYIALDIRNGIKLKEAYEKAEQQHHHSVAVFEKKGKRPKKLLITRCKRVDAIEYNAQKMEEARGKLNEWNARPIDQVESSGFSTVVFRSQNLSEAVLLNKRSTAKQLSTKLADAGEVFQPQMENSKKHPLKKAFGYLLIRNAYEPNDIQWKNIGAKNSSRLVRGVIANVVLIFVLIFLSTPPAMVSALQELLALPGVRDAWGVSTGAVRGWTGIFGSLLFKYLPTLLQLAAAFILIAIIKGFTRFQLFITRSRENRELLRRMYTYLILGTLILPSLALVALDGVISWLSYSDPISILQHMYIPSGGVFFLLYLLNFLFIRTTMSLINLGVLIPYAIRRARAVSDREKRECFQGATFEYSTEYALTIAVLGIVLSYSVLSPLILPIGLALFVYKYFVDKYNLLRVYDLSDNQNRLAFEDRSHKKRQITICQLVIANLIIFELFMMIYFVRTGQLWAHFILSAILFIATIALQIAIPIISAIHDNRESKKKAFEAVPIDIFQYYEQQRIAECYSTPEVVAEQQQQQQQQQQKETTATTGDVESGTADLHGTPSTSAAGVGPSATAVGASVAAST